MAREPKLISLPVGKPVSLWKGSGFDSQWLGSITVKAICPRRDGLINVFFCWESDKPLSLDWVRCLKFAARKKGGNSTRHYVVSSFHERSNSETAVIVLRPAP